MVMASLIHTLISSQPLTQHYRDPWLTSEIVCDGIVTGSDEEQALVNAAKIVFPNTKQLFCMLHCKENVRHHLTSIGVAVSAREQILSKLFGCNGVAEAEHETTMDDRIAKLLQYVRQNNVDAVLYLQDRVLQKMASNNRHKWSERWIGPLQWNNNNCESANHLLKVQVCIACYKALCA